MPNNKYQPSHRINIASGAVIELFTYKICVCDSLVSIVAPWEIEDIPCWVSEVETTTTIQDITSQPIFISSVSFNESTEWVGSQVARYYIEIPDNYDYVKYSAVGPSHQALNIFRSAVYVDRVRLKNHFEYVYAAMGDSNRQS